MNRPLRSAAVAAVALALAAAPALAKKQKDEAAATENTVAVVNGKPIPNARLDNVVAGQVAQAAQQGQEIAPEKREELRKAMRDRLITFEVLEQAALAKGLDKKAEVRVQMDMARQNVLVNAYIGDYVRAHPITDEAIKKEYDAIRVRLAGEKEYKARHILMAKEADAQAIIEKIKKGERFEDLAKQSVDPGSKDNGGDLGWASPRNYVKPFADALVKLENGKYTDTPVKTDFGYHVIMLDDTREMKAPPLDGIKNQIGQGLQQQLIERHIGELRTKAKID